MTGGILVASRNTATLPTVTGGPREPAELVLY